MTELQFWQLVSATDPLADSDNLAQCLTKQLALLDNDQLAAFDKIFNQKMRQAYTWDLWGAAFVIAGCNSEFAFAEFRCWLISRGQQAFEQALLNPDSLVTQEINQKDGFANPYLDEYDLIAGQLYEERTEQELPFVPSGQTQPQGKRFKDKARLVKKTYPDLFAKYWAG